MANNKQARKRILINAKKRLRNMSTRSAVKTSVKNATSAIMEERNVEKAEKLVGDAIRKVDKATTKGIMHKNTAARRKSRLMAKLNDLKAESAA